MAEAAMERIFRTQQPQSHQPQPRAGLYGRLTTSLFRVTPKRNSPEQPGP
jgi:hypothetical protein